MSMTVSMMPGNTCIVQWGVNDIRNALEDTRKLEIKDQCAYKVQIFSNATRMG